MLTEHLLNFWDKYQNLLSILFGGAGVAIISGLIKLIFFSNKVNNTNSNSGPGNQFNNLRDYNHTETHNHGLSESAVQKIVETIINNPTPETRPFPSDEAINLLTNAINRIQDSIEEKRVPAETLDFLQSGNITETTKILESKSSFFNESDISLSKHYCSIGALEFYNSTSKSIQAFTEAYSLDKYNSEAIIMLGHLYKRAGQLEKSESYFLEVLKISLPESKERSTALGNIGLLLCARGKINEAITNFEEALKIDTVLDRTEARVKGFNNLANIYRNQGKIDKSTSLITSALNVSRNAKYKEGIADSLSNLASLERTTGSLDKSITTYHEAIEIHKETKNKLSLATTLNDLGLAYYEAKLYQKSRDTLNNALDIATSLDDKLIISRICGDLALVEMSSGNEITAMRLLNDSLKIDIETNNIEGQARRYGNLAELHRKKGDYQTAKHLCNKAITLNTNLSRKTGLGFNYLCMAEINFGSKETDDAKRYAKKAKECFLNINDYNSANKANLLLEKYKTSQ